MTRRAWMPLLLATLTIVLGGCEKRSSSGVSPRSEASREAPHEQPASHESNVTELDRSIAADPPPLSEDRTSDVASAPASGLSEPEGELLESVAANRSPTQLAPIDGTAPGRTNEESLDDWPDPVVALVVTGRQFGYIEPCGCTGLDRQKGGLARRHTLLKQLRDERRWAVVPLDAGNQVRRFGRQAEIKFQITAEALRTMGYEGATFGLDDLRLTIDELAATTAQLDDQTSLFVSANVAVLDRDLTPRYRVIEAGGKRIAVTGVLADSQREQLTVEELVLQPAEPALRATWGELESLGCDYHVLLVQGTLEETLTLARAVPHFDLVVTSGGGEEPSYEPEPIDGTDALLVKVGAKGMYAGVVGLYDDAARPWRYQRVALDHRFSDAREMRNLMATYQSQLERLGLDGLGLRPVPHPTGRSFVGSHACQECHEGAYDVWSNSRHAHALDSLVHPTERSDIARHFDPECLSCHVTGWNPQRFSPYTSGYLSLEGTPHLAGSGCENCHGPGSAHVAAQRGEIDVDAATERRFREEMQISLADAEKKCMECHDLDNSPDFHEPGAFLRYWEQIAH